MNIVHSSSFKSKELFTAQFQKQACRANSKGVYSANFWRDTIYSSSSRSKQLYTIYGSNSRKNVTLPKLLQRAATVYSQLHFGRKKAYTAQNAEGKRVYTPSFRRKTVYTAQTSPNDKKCFQLKFQKLKGLYSSSVSSE